MKIETAPVKTEPVKVVEPQKVEEPVVQTVQLKAEEPVVQPTQPKVEELVKEPAKTEVKVEKVIVDWSKSYEDMTIEELQEAILEKMRKNGPVTEYMLGTVRENTHRWSLITWVKSFI